MLRNLSLCAFFALGLAAPAQDDDVFAVATTLDPTKIEAAITATFDEMEDETAIVGVPQTKIFCPKTGGYEWDKNMILNALWQSLDCNPEICKDSATGNKYPHGYTNQSPPRWKCGGNEAAGSVQEFPLMKGGKTYESGAPGIARVFYSVSRTSTSNPSGYATAVMYCGVAYHGDNKDFVHCNGEILAKATAAPTANPEL